MSVIWSILESNYAPAKSPDFHKKQHFWMENVRQNNVTATVSSRQCYWFISTTWNNLFWGQFHSKSKRLFIILFSVVCDAIAYNNTIIDWKNQLNNKKTIRHGNKSKMPHKFNFHFCYIIQWMWFSGRDWSEEPGQIASLRQDVEVCLLNEKIGDFWRFLST